MPDRTADDVFTKFPTNATLTTFNHDKACGVAIHWSMAGQGFGELVFAIDKATGEIRGDTEHMGPETCGRILDALSERGYIVSAHGFVDVGSNLKLPETVINIRLDVEEYDDIIDFLQDVVDGEKDNPDVQTWVPMLTKLRAQRKRYYGK